MKKMTRMKELMREKTQNSHISLLPDDMEEGVGDEKDDKNEIIDE